MATASTELYVDLDQFPGRQEMTFLGYCSVSPICGPAADRSTLAIERQKLAGRGMFAQYPGSENLGRRYHRNFGQLLKTDPSNLSMVANTSQGISMIANGYPFQPGDQIISYVNEYPSNHYPWVVQAKRRGVELVLLSDTEFPQEQRDYVGPVPDSFARGWSFEELKAKVTPRTRMIAISHVQFHSGFAADLKTLGQFCREHDVDLVVDAAQSLGCLPLYPEELGIACVASAGWKWLLGPLGAGVLYTAPEFREKIEITMTGADHMHQQTEYLDHGWKPFTCGRKFEYSTVPFAGLDGLSVGVEKVFLPNAQEAIWNHNLQLQELALEHLDMAKYQPIVHVPEHRSGILSLIPKVSSASQISALLEQENIVVTPRDGYLRFAPHLCTTADEVMKAIEALNAIRR